MIDLPQSLWPAVYRLAGRSPWPPQTVGDARALIDRATRDDLLPLLFDDASAPAIVRDILQSMTALRRLHEHRVATMSEAIHDLARALEGEPFALLKGAEYAYRLYARPVQRPFRDIDLFVPRARMIAVADRLMDSGWSEAFVNGPEGNVAAHHERSFRRGGITADLHHSFIQRARAAIDYDAIWARRVPAKIDGVDTFRLSDEDALFYQAYAISIHELHLPVIRYLDLQRMIAMNGDALAAAAANAARWRARHAFFAALRQAQRIFPELETDAVNRTLSELVSSATRLRIERDVLPDPAEPGSSARPLARREQLRRKLLLIDGPYLRLRFGAYYLWAHVAGRIVK